MTRNVKNADKLIAKLGVIVPEINREILERGDYLVGALANRAKTLAPRSEGAGSVDGGRHYADTIHSERIEENKSYNRPTASWGVFAYWTWRFIEFGTQPHGAHPGTRPRPHLYPAYKQMRGRIVDGFAAAGRTAVKRIARQ